MALLLQVVGIPLSPYRRWHADLAQWAAAQEPETHVRFAPSSNHHAPIIGDPELGQVDANLAEGFCHIAVMAGRSARAMAERYRYDCRVPIVTGISVNATDSSAAPLISALDATLSYERRWKEVVGPEASSHPLLLPPPTFVPHNEVWDFWHECDCYQATTKIDRANTILQRVHARHRRRQSGVGTIWIDRDDRQFVIDPSKHGVAARARDGRRLFRFARETPPDLHFDVTHVRGTPFRIRDRFGNQAVVSRANVTPWGDVRPAKSA